MSEWRRVFWLTFFIEISAVVIFSIWASGEVQPWNTPSAKTKKNATNGTLESTDTLNTVVSS